MDSTTRDDATSKGAMWELDQNLDQPMDEEAGRLRNMYREKVFFFLLIYIGKLSNLFSYFF
jgi:KUP system potassium uptake protein